MLARGNVEDVVGPPLFRISGSRSDMIDDHGMAGADRGVNPICVRHPECAASNLAVAGVIRSEREHELRRIISAWKRSIG